MFTKALEKKSSKPKITPEINNIIETKTIIEKVSFLEGQVTLETSTTTSSAHLKVFLLNCKNKKHNKPTRIGTPC